MRRLKTTERLPLTPGSPTQTRPATASRTTWIFTDATRPCRPKARMWPPVSGTRGFIRASVQWAGWLNGTNR